ncbi:MAG: phosphoglycerate dehydrogenase, partial [Candidatus Eremiobacterota bacterium]
RAGVGVDNIDVEAATQRGILVVNSPGGNTISAAEHTMALLLSAARKVPQAHASMVSGKWDRKTFTGVELYQKTLGVVGLGRIGREVAVRAASFAMRVVAYDPFLSADYARDRGIEPMSIDDLLAVSDYVTLHVPLSDDTRNLISAERIRRMKKGAVLVNCARGGIVDEQALFEALKNRHLGAAALDVYQNEPPTGSPLLSLDNVVLTPHLAASTHEAQHRVAVDVAEQILEVFRGNPPRSAVNIPYLRPEVMSVLRPYLHLAEQMGKFAGTLAQGPIRRVRITYRGSLSDFDVSFLTKAALRGLLWSTHTEIVNFVNAAVAAQERGIEVSETTTRVCPTYSSLIDLEVESEKGDRHVAGAVFEDQPRVVGLDSYPISLVPEGIKLITWQTDQPGVVGKVGTLLGDGDVNIAEMQVGRSHSRGRAVMVMALDERPDPSVLERIRQLAGIEDARLVVL